MGFHPDPLSAVSSTINATIKILEVTYQLKAVDQQTADLLSTTRHVDFMLQQASRLRRLKAGLLNTSERTMVDTVISDTEDALRAVAKLVEPCRVDKDTTNGIKFGHRVMWVFRDNPSVRDKHQKLQICYQSLTIVFNCLYSKDVVVIAPIPEVRNEEQPPPYDPQLKELLEWQNRRKGRKSKGERESIRDESLGVTNGNANPTHVAGTSSPCLLAIDLDDSGRTSSLSSYTDMFSESLVTPTADALPSALSNSDTLLSPATPSADSTNASPHSSAHSSFYNDENRSTPPSVHSRTHNDCFGSKPNLPKIDSPPFASMIAPYQFNSDDKDGLQVGGKYPAHVSIPASDQAPPSALALDTTLSTTPTIPSLPHTAVATPTSSELSARGTLRSRWPDLSSRSDRCVSQEPAEALYPPLRARMKSDDIEAGTTYQSDRLDAIARVEDVMSTGEKVTMSGQQGVMKRRGRSWLACHATRSDTGDGMDWKG